MISIKLSLARRVALGGLLAVFLATPALSCRAELPAEIKESVKAVASKLKAAEHIELKGKRTVTGPLAESTGASAESKLTVMVIRPSHFKASASSGDAQVREVYFDGKQVTLFDSNTQTYAAAPIEGTIDDLIVATEEKFGFSPPVIDLFFSKLGENVADGDVFDGEGDANHFKLSTEEISWEVWVGEDQLIRKMQIVFLDQEGGPSITVEDMEWNLEAEIDEAEFAFAPPEGATKAEMLTREQIEEELAREKKE